MLVSNLIFVSGSDPTGSLKFYSGNDVLAFGPTKNNSLETKLYKEGSAPISLLFITASGNNPRVGVGTTDPKSTFEFVEISDTSKGSELVLAGSRTAKGAIVGDSAGILNFAIPTGSVDILTTGSVGKIKGIVTNETATGVEGKLTLELFKNVYQSDDVVEFGYNLGNVSGLFNAVYSSSIELKDYTSVGYSRLSMYDFNNNRTFEVLQGSITASGGISADGNLNVGGNIIAQGDIIAENYIVSSSVTYMTQSFSSGSTIFGDTITDTHQFTGSMYTTGTMELNGTMIISGANPGTPPSALQVYGDIQTYGYHRFDPVTTNIDTSISASYIYVSGSTEDLYFSQNGKGYSNVTRLRWLEGNIYTGILNGGIVSATPGGTTFNVAAGEGIIVTLNASTSSLNDGPFPVITSVKWDDFTGITPDYLTTHDTTWLTIDSSGALVQQTDAPTNGQFDTHIQVGVVLHPNKTTISLAKTFTVTSYGIGQQTYEFIRTFGGIKVSGHAINPSGSSLYINRDPGVAFALGRNYVNDPNKPSYVEEDGYNSPNLFKYYKSGSEFVTTVGTNTIDPNYYNTPDVGTGLSAVPGGQYTIKRFFYFPNSPDTVGVYYGRQTYNSISTALANLPYEEFEELDNTLNQAIFCGYLIVKGGTTNLSNTSNAKFIQAGTFRNTLSGGGGATTSNLNALSDVTIGTPLQGQVLKYDSGVSQWVNSYTGISGSFTGSFNGTATNATNVNVGNSDGSSTYFIVGALGSGNQPLKRDSALTFDASADTLITTNLDSSKIFIGTSDIELRGNAYNFAVFNGGIEAAGAITASGAVLTGDLIVTGSQLITNNITSDGTIRARVKSFDIPHPTRKNKRLVYGALEGPEHGIYCRGEAKELKVKLPPEWRAMVDKKGITVQITPIGGWQPLYFEKLESNWLYFGCGDDRENVHFYWEIKGERTDVPKLETVQ